jgi:prepilin-type processing-associated H-X9-DG protein
VNPDNLSRCGPGKNDESGRVFGSAQLRRGHNDGRANAHIIELRCKNTSPQNGRIAIIAGVGSFVSQRSTVTGQGSLPRIRSYSVSGLFNDYPGPPWIRSQGAIDKYSEAARPTGIFGFICEGENTIACGGFWCNEYFDWAVWWNIPAVRHSRGANLSFIDGHADYHRWKYEGRERRIRDMLTSPVVATDKADQEDLMWLIQRTPYWYWAQRKGPHF